MADIIKKVMRFFEAERRVGHPLFFDDPEKRLEEATGLSKRTLRRHLEEQAIEVPVIDMDERRGTATSTVDEFDQAVIRNKVHEMYLHNEAVTLRTLKTRLLPDITVSLSTLWRTLRLIGFRFVKKGAGKRVVAERTDIISQRHQYLRELRRARERGEHIIYLDETWVNVNHVRVGDWSENVSDSVGRLVGSGCGDCGRTIPTGKGKRIIVLDAGCRDVGLLPSVADVFVAKSDSGDYHSEMNHEHFINWWRNTLLPALPGPSTIVLDQAPYHCVLTDDSRAPNSKSKVQTIRTWLQDKGIAFTDDLLKAELLEIVRRNKPRPRYIVDQVAAAAGHKVLRLPPRHCELNPIELIWANIKGFVARNNTTFKLVDTMRLFHQGKALISPDVWNSAEDHVIHKIECKLWEGDNVQDQAVDPVIISLDEADDDDDFTYVDDVEEDISTDLVALETVDGLVGDVRTDETGDACGDMETSDELVPCLLCGSVSDPPEKVVSKKKRERRKKGGKSGDMDECAEYEWVMCDTCDKWAHVDCIPGCDTNGLFICPPCKLKLRTSNK